MWLDCGEWGEWWLPEGSGGLGDPAEPLRADCYEQDQQDWRNLSEQAAIASSEPSDVLDVSDDDYQPPSA